MQSIQEKFQSSETASHSNDWITHFGLLRLKTKEYNPSHPKHFPTGFILMKVKAVMSQSQMLTLILNPQKGIYFVRQTTGMQIHQPPIPVCLWENQTMETLALKLIPAIILPSGTPIPPILTRMNSSA